MVSPASPVNNDDHDSAADDDDLNESVNVKEEEDEEVDKANENGASDASAAGAATAAIPAEAEAEAQVKVEVDNEENQPSSEVSATVAPATATAAAATAEEKHVNDGGSVGAAEEEGNDDGAAAGGGDEEDSEDEAKVDVDGNDDGDGDAPPAKRARTASSMDTEAADTDAAAEEPSEETSPVPLQEIQQAVLKYKRKNGTTYNINYEEDGEPQSQSFGIKLAAVKVKNAHSFLPHYFEKALGEKYKGRPPAASDQAVMVEKIMNTAPAAVKASVQRNDVLLFMDEKLVNITDKKRLQYYKARLINRPRPMKLSFFRPSEGTEEPDQPDQEEAELDPTEAFYMANYEPPEDPEPTKPKAWGAVVSKNDRQARRALLERRLEELESLQLETSAELKELLARDGIEEGADKSPKEEEKEKKRKRAAIKGEDDFTIPSHIMYFPPVKLKRKKLPALNDVCNKCEDILRERTAIDKEADKMRIVIEQAKKRLANKEEEMKALDQKMVPVLEELKLIEMQVHDNWKVMYLKLKEYFEENGHTNVPEKENMKLAKWATRQRQCYANAQLKKPNATLGMIKPYQYELLNQIEFSWNPREQQFTQNIAMLREFKAQHGHTNVPMKYQNMQLANFVQKWRREYRLYREGKPCNMSEDRLHVLEEAGFTWRDPSRTRKRSDTRQETWDGFISQLKEFNQKYGHFMVNKVNKSREKGNRLGRLDEFCGWVRKQYTLYKEGWACQLTTVKVEQLREMGFWLERGEAQRFSVAAKKEKEDSDDTTELGELQVPVVNSLAGNTENAEESAAAEEGGDTDMTDGDKVTIV